MLEEFQIKGQPKIKKVIAISELAKYGPDDKLLVLVDVDNVDDLNEQVEMFAMAFKDSGFKGQIILDFADVTMREFVVGPNNEITQKEPKNE